MSIVKRNHVFFPSFVNELFKPDWFGGIENHDKPVPAVNIRENEKDFSVELAVPGLKKEDFNVEVDQHVMTISAEVKHDSQPSKENFTRREFSYSSFKRSFSLPESVAEDQINAAYTDGVLKLTLPKKEEALPKPKRLIEIGK